MSRNSRLVVTVALVLGVFGAAGVQVPGMLGTAAVAAPELPDAPLVLVMNLPSYRLDVYEDGERTRSYSVSVGARGFETPAGDYKLSRAVWNPWWHPPNSAWAKNEKPTPPGPNNPMGRVKLFFHGLYYIHGSPLEGTIGEAASHGCIRMRNADVIELAKLVHSYATPDIEPSTFASLVDKPSATKTIKLAHPIPLLVTYELAELRDGHLVVYPDVYRKARASKKDLILRVLRDAGYDLARVSDAWVDGLVQRSEKELVVVRSDELSSGGVSAPVADAASQQD